MVFSVLLPFLTTGWGIYICKAINQEIHVLAILGRSAAHNGRCNGA